MFTKTENIKSNLQLMSIGDQLYSLQYKLKKMFEVCVFCY